MPTHSKAKSHRESDGARPAERSKVATRSAVTGKKLGKAAQRAVVKNADCIDQMLAILERADDADDVVSMTGGTLALTLGRVIRSPGGGRLEVNVLVLPNAAAPLTGRPIAEVCSVPVCGNLRIKGRSQTKTDFANCMLTDDIIVIRGGFASGKMGPAMAQAVQRQMDRLRLSYPPRFFAGRTCAWDADEEDDLFDRTGDLDGEMAEAAAVRATAGGNGGLRERKEAPMTAEEIDAI